jgi:putative membrane protein
MMHWGTLFMTVSSILFWALVVAGVVVLVRYAGRGIEPSALSDQNPTPLQALADRFARSEIDEEEYARRLRILSESDR